MLLFYLVYKYYGIFFNLLHSIIYVLHIITSSFLFKTLVYNFNFLRFCNLNVKISVIEGGVNNE